MEDAIQDIELSAGMQVKVLERPETEGRVVVQLANKDIYEFCFVETFVETGPLVVRLRAAFRNSLLLDMANQNQKEVNETLDWARELAEELFRERRKRLTGSSLFP